MGLTISDFWNMPLGDIMFYIDRLTKELKGDETEGDQSVNRAMRRDERAALGMQRAETPARLRRFT